MRFGGKRALVTASSSGIGLGVAERFAQEGADVFLSGIEEDLLERVAGEIEAEHGTSVYWRVADFTHPGACEALGEAAVDAMGGVDILFSNTGGPKPGKFLDTSLADWDRAYRLILESAVGLTRAVLPAMMEQRSGRLIYSTSNGVMHPLPQLHLSNVLRSGVVALAHSLVNEIGPYGITAHVVAPGSIQTERQQQNFVYRAEANGKSPGEVKAMELSQIAVDRFGTVEDVAALVAFLASDEAGYLTGSITNVDGGMVFMPLL